MLWYDPNALEHVTRERLAEAEREQLLCQLEQAVRVRDDFLSIAGHEIRTPLTALLLNLKTLTHAAHAIDTRSRSVTSMASVWAFGSRGRSWRRAAV